MIEKLIGFCPRLLRRSMDFATFSRIHAPAPDQLRNHRIIDENVIILALDLHVLVLVEVVVVVDVVAAEAAEVDNMIVRIRHHQNVLEYSIYPLIQLRKICVTFSESSVTLISVIWSMIVLLETPEDSDSFISPIWKMRLQQERSCAILI